MNDKLIEQILDENAEKWLSINGVVGVGVGQEAGKPCLKIYATSLTPELNKEVPNEIDGYQVVFEITGPFGAL